MSLDLTLTVVRPVEVHHQNITHNLFQMADAAGFGKLLWGDEKPRNAAHLADAIEVGLDAMRADPERFKAYDAENGWGTYKDFVPWLERLVEACRANPDAQVEVSR